MNKEVNFEIAKLLKEKGFSEEVRDYYGEKDGVFYHSQYFRDNISINEKHKGFVTAPTISDVVMWLYEKHGIWIYIKQGYKWEWYIETVANHPELKYNDGLEDSPTEAYEAAIKYVLKNLI